MRTSFLLLALDYIQPVCLPTYGQRLVDGQIGTVTGWGNVEYYGQCEKQRHKYTAYSILHSISTEYFIKIMSVTFKFLFTEISLAQQWYTLYFPLK